MDYKAFFADVEEWIVQANQTTLRLGLGSDAFWEWVAESTAAICRKYNDNRLAIKQMMMMVEWLEEIDNKKKGR